MNAAEWEDVFPRFERMFLRVGHRKVAEATGVDSCTLYRLYKREHRKPQPRTLRDIIIVLREWEAGGFRVPVSGRADAPRGDVLANANGR